MAYAVQATTHYQTYLDSRGRSTPEKVCNLDPMARRPWEKRQSPRAPSSRRSGLFGPHTTPPIVNYEYRHLHRGYFAPTARDVTS